MTTVSGRLLPLTAGSPSLNMAVDQALLESVEQTGVPVLRFYGWIEPTLSLGYFQPYRSRESHNFSTPAACVRRSTGGGAILHHHELTYCLVAPMPASATQRRKQLYQQAHDSIAAVLANFGVHARVFRLTGSAVPSDSPFLCFQRRTDEDLIISGYKVLGSAQRRTRHAVLQHGSLLLRASSLAPELPGILDLTSRNLDPIELVQPIADSIGKLLGCGWTDDELNESERRRAYQIESEKFAETAWNHRR